MRLPISVSEIPPRLSVGAFILNSGLSKREVDDETAAAMHGFAAGTYPFVAKLEPKQFVKALSAAEIAIGGLLLVPFVPTAVAGAALTAFSAGLLGLYLRTPGMRKPGSLAPTEQGLPLAKDIWLLGLGIGLLTKGTIERGPRISVRQADRLAKKAAKEAAKQATLRARKAA